MKRELRYHDDKDKFKYTLLPLMSYTLFINRTDLPHLYRQFSNCVCGPVPTARIQCGPISFDGLPDAGTLYVCGTDSDVRCVVVIAEKTKHSYASAATRILVRMTQIQMQIKVQITVQKQYRRMRLVTIDAGCVRIIATVVNCDKLAIQFYFI